MCLTIRKTMNLKILCNILEDILGFMSHLRLSSFLKIVRWLSFYKCKKIPCQRQGKSLTSNKSIINITSLLSMGATNLVNFIYLNIC